MKKIFLITLFLAPSFIKLEANYFDKFKQKVTSLFGDNNKPTSSQHTIPSYANSKEKEEKLQKIKTIYILYLASFLGEKEEKIKKLSLEQLVSLCSFPPYTSQALERLARGLESENIAQEEFEEDFSTFSNMTEKQINNIKTILSLPKGEETFIPHYRKEWKSTSEIEKRSLVETYLCPKLLKNLKPTYSFPSEIAPYLTTKQITELSLTWLEKHDFGKEAQEKTEALKKEKGTAFYYNYEDDDEAEDLFQQDQARFFSYIPFVNFSQEGVQNGLTNQQLEIIFSKYGPALQIFHGEFKDIKKLQFIKKTYGENFNPDFISKLSKDQLHVWYTLLTSPALTILELPNGSETEIKGTPLFQRDFSKNVNFFYPISKKWGSFSEKEQKYIIKHFLNVPFLKFLEETIGIKNIHVSLMLPEEYFTLGQQNILFPS